MQDIKPQKKGLINLSKWHLKHYCSIPLEWPESEFWQGSGAVGTLIHCWWECRMNGIATLEDRLAAAYKAAHSYHTISSHAPWYSSKVENLPHIHTETSTWMFIVALFINCQLRYPSVSEWVNELWHIQTMGCYSALKRNLPNKGMKIHGTLNAYYKWNLSEKVTYLYDSNYMMFRKRHRQLQKQ